MSKDYYSILGVKRDATEDDVKKSFRRLAHEHHPDKGGDQQKFKDINEAYQILGDKEKRAQYDRFGSAAFEQGGFGGFQGVDINFQDLGDIGDMFGEMFGFGGRKGGKGARGNDIETELTLDFLDTVKGVNKTIKLYKNDRCEECKGTGADKASKIETCKTCGGKGRVMQATRTFFGTVQTQATCPECQGQGSKPERLCGTCSGTGVQRKTRELEIRVPAGMSEGEALRIHSEGEYPGRGGTPGDLFVRVTVKSHPTFTRQGEDVVSSLRVQYSVLALGGEVEIETVDGTGSLKIPESTDPGTTFKIRGKGFVNSRSGNRGDQLVTVQAMVGKKLNPEQRKALKGLMDAGL